MKRRLAMLACALGLTAWATADYYAIDGSTLTITVPQNITENFDTSFLANVTGNAVTDIVKEGDGTLVMNSNISAYAGTIHVNHGVWVLVDANSLGSLTGGGVFVATLPVSKFVCRDQARIAPPDMQNRKGSSHWM